MTRKKNEFPFMIYVQLNVNDRRAQDAMLQLAIMNHKLIIMHDEVQARWKRRVKRFWVHPWLSTALLLRSCHFCYDSLTTISNRSGIAVPWNGGGGGGGGLGSYLYGDAKRTVMGFHVTQFTLWTYM